MRTTVLQVSSHFFISVYSVSMPSSKYFHEPKTSTRMRFLLEADKVEFFGAGSMSLGKVVLTRLMQRGK